MRSSEKTYPSKLLLFGEHTVLTGSKALAVPFSLFKGQWRRNNTDHSLQQDLPRLLHFLESKQQTGELPFSISLSAFKEDLSKGWYFESTIPQGYGVGSSGALCAAIYDKYAEKREDHQLNLLKKKLAFLESFFHGQSSGTDPLIIYLNAPLLIDESKNSLPVQPERQSISGNYRYFLMDTGIKRLTAPYVQSFLQQYQSENYQRQIDKELSPLINKAIDSFLLGNDEKVFLFTKKISEQQFVLFKKMIPDSFIDRWEKSLSIPSVAVKLCGAGGGGFLLVISTLSYSEVVDTLSLQKNQLIPLKGL